MSIIINTILSIIGCITGTLSLIILYRQHAFNRGKIIISPIPEKPSFYFDPQDLDISGHYSRCMACITLNIVNKSSYPLSINEIYILTENIKCKHDPDFDIKFINIPGTNIEMPMEPSCKLPLTLKPFEIKDIGIRFKDFRKHISSYRNPSSIKIIFSTSRGDIKVNLTVKEIHRA